MNRRTTYTLLALATTALAAIAAAALPGEYEGRVVAFFDSALVKGGVK